ncbi:MAG: class I SAM-dependent methyltransferase, partial [Chthoniobacterales bacterium]
HGQDIYEGFDHRKYTFDLRGWGGESPIFGELVREVRPSLIIEVGSWKGASAVSMAEAVRQAGLDTKILCVDTWLGALEFRLDQNDPERFFALECEHGYPRVYYRFLANVCHTKHQQRIIPFPLDSAAAALWLMSHGIKADLIYIDGSNEEEAVYNDLIDYGQLLAPHGVIFGDDWTWASVRSAVSLFAKEHKLKLALRQDKWVLSYGHRAK